VFWMLQLWTWISILTISLLLDGCFFFFFDNVLEVVRLCRSFIKMHYVHYLLLTPLDFVYFGIFHEFLLFWNSL
jgi:hypothetical protein